jgi:hypothetical protein
MWEKEAVMHYLTVLATDEIQFPYDTMVGS